MQKKYYIILEKDSFPIEREVVDKLINCSNNIWNQLIDTGDYFVQSKVSKEILVSYLKYIKDDNQIPEIDVNNILDYHVINKEIKYMTNLLKETKYEDIYFLSILTKTETERNLDRSFYENKISQELGRFLSEYPDEMSNIQLNSLYNIFFSNQRVLENQEIAYQFIKKNAKKDKTFCILLKSLDGIYLNEESLKESIVKREENYNFTPKVDVSFIDNINQMISHEIFRCEQKSSKIINILQTKFDQIELKYDVKACYDEIKSFSISFFSNTIDKNFFSTCQNLVRVVIPPSVIYIDDSAFYGLSTLKDVVFPESLISIKNSAFSGCTSLTKVEFPQSLTYIGCNAFSQCKSLNELEFPPSLTMIENSAFEKCKSLTHLEFKHPLFKIGQYAFHNCSSIKTIAIMKNIENIESHTFDNCSSLESIHIQSLTRISDYMFQNCISLKEVSFPSSLVTIEESAFFGCSSLQKVDIPSSVKTIKKNAFLNCASLIAVKIPGLFQSNAKTFLPENINISYY